MQNLIRIKKQQSKDQGIKISLQSQKKVALSCSLFLLVLFWRSPILFIEPRFWAEEGSYYYSSLQQSDLATALTLVIRGNFQLLTNMCAYFASMVPSKYAAYITTYLSLIVSLIFISLIGAMSNQQKWSTWLTLIIVAIIALLPHGYEIYLTSTNVQWVCSVSMLLIFMLEIHNPTRTHVTLFYLWSILCGLTGVCSAMLAPAFLLRKWVTPSKHHFRIGIILSICAIIELLIAITHSQPDRHFNITSYVLIVPAIFQTVISPTLGGSIADKLARYVSSNGSYSVIVLICIITSTLFLVANILRTALKEAHNKSLLIIVVALWLGVTTLNTIGSIGNPDLLVSGWAHGRYFYFGAISFIIILGMVASKKNNIANFLLIIMLTTGIVDIYRGNWKKWMTSGTSWQTQVEKCDTRPCMLQVWAGGFILLKKE